MRSLVPLFALASCLLAYGDESGGDQNALMRVFKPESAVVLEQPFVGAITLLFPRGLPADCSSRLVRLNSLKPAKDVKADSKIQCYILADAGGGSSSLGDVYILRDKLPNVEGFSFESSSFEKLTGLLGEPTCRSKDIRKVEGFNCELVGWKFFSPIDQHTVKVLEVVVEHQRNQDGTDANYSIRVYGIYRGTLKKSEHAVPSDGDKPSK